MILVLAGQNSFLGLVVISGLPISTKLALKESGKISILSGQ
jgi:hypothetical protein